MAQVQPFKDPYSALSRGIESGTRMGLMISNQEAEEDKFEFLKLQQDLENKRTQDKADRDFNLQKLEKSFDFHVKTKNVVGARKALQGMDELGGTDLASRITDDRLGEFNDKMKQLDKADPSVQGDLMQEILQSFPTISYLKGGAAGMGLTRTRREGAVAAGFEAMVTEQYLETGRPSTGLMGDKKAGGDLAKRSKAVFDTTKAVSQTPNEFGTLTLDSETVRLSNVIAGRMLRDPQYDHLTPQEISEASIREAKALPGKASERLKSGISREPSRKAGAPKAGDGILTSNQPDKATAEEFLRQAGGDNAKARQLAREAGYF